NMKRLSSSENQLVAFTLAVQAALGIFFTLTLGNWLGVDAIESAASSAMYLPMVIVSLGLAAFGLLMSVTHLGKPFRFYRGFNNWRHSPVCREGLGISGFLAFGALHVLTQLPAHPWMPDFILNMFGISAATAATIAKLGAPTALLTMISGGIGLYYMYRCYRIPARPFWDHISTGTHFVGNAMALGALLIAFAFAPFVESWSALMSAAAFVAFIGVSLEGIGLTVQANDYKTAKHEGAVSHYIQRTTFGNTYLYRNALVGFNAAMAALIAFGDLPMFMQVACLLLLTVGVATTAVIGRCLFYVLVIPTTMPGAFFWKNKAFVEHARDIGMDHMPNSGVVPARH
ncbi:MAG: dimethyl sulfoxide reductase anchor subunit, partial [Pseudomonadales bacterium]|nr:dimethyl sulfoxide reductase anchor subunit [Pseudomonadales bacterium]